MRFWFASVAGISVGNCNSAWSTGRLFALLKLQPLVCFSNIRWISKPPKTNGFRCFASSTCLCCEVQSWRIPWAVMPETVLLPEPPVLKLWTLIDAFIITKCTNLCTLQIFPWKGKTRFPFLQAKRAGLCEAKKTQKKSGVKHPALLLPSDLRPRSPTFFIYYFSLQKASFYTLLFP